MTAAPVEYWYVERDGEIAGPLPREDIEAALAANELPATALVWRAGLPGWRRAADMFLPPAKPPATPVRRRLALAALTGLAVAATAAFFYPKDGVLDVGMASSDLPLMWAALAGVTVIACGIAIDAWWRHARDLNANGHAPLAPGLIKAACVTASAGLVCFAAFAVATVRVSEDLAAVLAGYEDFTIAYDADEDALRVDGTIGPRFGARLSAALAEHPTAALLRIDSIGGLVDEAMEAARSVEARGLTILVNEQCSSACLILYAAGAKHHARWNATFGFHAISPVLGGLAADVKATEKQGREADEYMIAHGIPRAFVDEGNRLGPQSVYLVAAVDLAHEGFVHDLYDDDGKPMPLDLARWRTMEELLFAENHQLAEIFGAIREAAPDEAVKHAPALFADATSADGETLIAAAYRLASDLRQNALQAADAPAIAEYARVRGQAIDALATEGDWSGCAALAADATQTQAVRSPLRQELASAFGRLIRSAAARKWARTAIGPDAHTTHAGLKADADLAVMLADGIDESADEDRRQCLHAQKLAQGMNALEPAHAADAFRYADSFGGWAD